MLNNLLFDLDGTLTDPFEGITRSVAHALAAFDIHVADRRTLAGYIGPPLKQSFTEFHGLSPDQAGQAVGHYRERFSTRGLYENVVYEGIATVLAERRAAGQRLFMATSKPTCFARTIAAHFGLADYFDGIYGSELDGTRTDKKALLAYLLAEEGLRAQETLMIGDRRYDIEGGAANGLATIGVCYGYGGARELRAAGADDLCDSPAELGAMLAAGRE